MTREEALAALHAARTAYLRRETDDETTIESLATAMRAARANLSFIERQAEKGK